MKVLTSASKPTPSNLLEMSKNLRNKYKLASSVDIQNWCFKSGHTESKYRIYIESTFHKTDIDSFSDVFDIYCELMSDPQEPDPIAEKESLLDQHYDDKFHAMKDEGEI